MRQSPAVSIVVPLYNSARFIAKTLQSIRGQTYTDWECVVMDDGSTDNSQEIARQVARHDERIVVHQQPNSGAAAARNNGFRLTDPRTRFVTFMDSDDLWEPRALELLIGALEAHPEMIGAHGVADLIDENDAPLNPGAFANGYCRNRLGFDGKQLRLWDASTPTNFNVLLLHGVYPPGLVLTRRPAVEAVGGFDPAVWPMEDWQLLVRLSVMGDFVFSDEVILRYRRHSGNATNSESNNRRVSHIMRHWMHFYDYGSPEHQALATRVYRPYQLHRIREKSRELSHCLRERKYQRLPVLLTHILGLGCRYVRGYPVVGGVLSG